MKIAWFTPFSAKSAIGRFSQGVTAELAKRASVEIFSFDTAPTHVTDIPVRKFRSAAAISDQALSTFDVIFYNFGNHLPFHLEIFKMSRRCPGVAVIHDFVMHHFFAGYYIDLHRSQDDYLKAVERFYGKQMRDAAAAGLKKKGRPHFWDTDVVADCPLFEEVLAGAQGVIAHSEFLKQRVAQVFGGPVRKIPLHYTINREGLSIARKHLGLSDDSLVILTIGHANPNKRITATIDAIGSIRDSAGPLTFVIAGPCGREYRREIDEAIRRNRLESVVKIAGEVTDEALRGYLSAADICVNLRYPAMEGASASAIEEMLYGKAIIVANVGFYAELPDQCVVKVEPNQPNDLRQALARLASDTSERNRLGDTALAYALKEYAADHYAELAIEFADEVRRARPLLSLTDKLAHECRRMGIVRETGVVDHLAEELSHLFQFHT